MPTRVLLFAALVATASSVAAAPTLVTKDNYKSMADSPFSLAGGYYLEDFEGGAINAPGLDIAIVDGATDPWGSKLAGPADSAFSLEPSGWSLRSEYAATRLDGFDFANAYIEFDATALGGLPTEVGFVFTRAEPLPDFIEFIVEGPEWFQGGRLDPTFAANRFVGARLEEGIKSLTLRLYHGFPSDPVFEIDHVQYGAIVPEPSTALLMVLGSFVVFARRRRRHPRLLLLLHPERHLVRRLQANDRRRHLRRHRLRRHHRSHFRLAMAALK
jgi:hypothetical protein